MSGQPTVDIRGIQVKDDQDPPPRLELTRWSKDPKNAIQVSLFIRALNRLQDTPHTETLSYFQIAGIHGYPGDLRWDNAPPPTHTREGQWTHYVYCTHNLMTFPTWHRPYMILYEQTLHANMVKIIHDELEFSEDNEKQFWLNEADNWRLPYWDWALPKTGSSLPDLFLSKEVAIKDPGSGESKTRNPLYRYQLMVDGKPKKMGDLPVPYRVDNVIGGTDPTWELPWKDCSGTSRWSITGPNDLDKWSGGESDPLKVRSAIDSHQYYVPGRDDDKDPLGIRKHTVSDLVYRLLVGGYVKTWREFSSTKYTLNPPPDWTGYLSLEYIHNNLHGFIGGEDLIQGVGHMQNVPVAAFDPVFYMHHCNIDRQFAIWQTLNEKNPDNWFKDTDELTENSPLSPFHRKDKAAEDLKLLTSKDVKSWRTFGYDYDILVRQGNETDDERVRRVTSYLDETYNLTSRGVLDAAAKNPHIFGRKFEEKYGLGLAEDLNASRKYPDYIINILYDRYALGGDPYTIHFFLGKRADVDAYVRPRDHITAQHPYHFGSVFSFSASMRDGETEYCANCADQNELGQMSTAQIPFTTALLARARDENVTSINSIEHDSVVTYLKDHLHWRALDITGAEVPKERLHRTKIFILQGTAEHYLSNDKISRYEYSDPIPLHEVTAGKRLGGAPDDYEHPAASLHLV